MHRYFSTFLVLPLSLFLCFACAPHRLVLPPEFSARVVGVKDGDTIAVLYRRKPIIIRLTGIDCPERRQPFGSRAKKLTSELAFGKTVRVEAKGRDRYGRTLGSITLEDGKNLSEILVKMGLAWWYRKYSTDETLMKLEAEARVAGRGLWRDPSPIPPWGFRKER